LCACERNKRDAGNREKLPLDAESSFHSALTGDDFSPGTAEFQQLAMEKSSGGFLRWLKKNAGRRTRRVDLWRVSPVSDSSLTGFAELYFGVDDS
jgi:hypothetical protein